MRRHSVLSQKLINIATNAFEYSNTRNSEREFWICSRRNGRRDSDCSVLILPLSVQSIFAECQWCTNLSIEDGENECESFITITPRWVSIFDLSNAFQFRFYFTFKCVCVRLISRFGFEKQFKWVLETCTLNDTARINQEIASWQTSMTMVAIAVVVAAEAQRRPWFVDRWSIRSVVGTILSRHPMEPVRPQCNAMANIESNRNNNTKKWIVNCVCNK